MDNNKTIVDVSGLGEVGCKLLDRIFDLCGWIYNNHPKVAAKKTLIEDISNSELPINEKVFLISHANKITKEYSNQKNIIDIALTHLEESAQPDSVDETWIDIFMDKARLVSTEQAQIIWGKLLAEEINNPNSIPKSLIFFLEQMDREDANSFIEICSCTVKLFNSDDEAFCPIIQNFSGIHYWNTKITFDKILRLEELGLLKQEFGILNPGFQTNFKNGSIIASYYNNSYSFPENYTAIPVGYVIFSQSGRELYKIVDAPSLDGFLESQCIPYWKSESSKFN